ncbi:hypothetical protein AGIG_G1679 [Arapaima gigas]
MCGLDGGRTSNISAALRVTRKRREIELVPQTWRGTFRLSQKHRSLLSSIWTSGEQVGRPSAARRRDDADELSQRMDGWVDPWSKSWVEDDRKAAWMERRSGSLGWTQFREASFASSGDQRAGRLTAETTAAFRRVLPRLFGVSSSFGGRERRVWLSAILHRSDSRFHAEPLHSGTTKSSVGSIDVSMAFGAEQPAGDEDAELRNLPGSRVCRF